MTALVREQPEINLTLTDQNSVPETQAARARADEQCINNTELLTMKPYPQQWLWIRGPDHAKRCGADPLVTS